MRRRCWWWRSAWWAGLDSFPLLAIPLFLLAGNLMTGAGLTRRIADLCVALVGHLRGGLGAAAVMGCALFSALSGSSIADVVAIGGIMLPAMTQQGYQRGFPARCWVRPARWGRSSRPPSSWWSMRR